MLENRAIHLSFSVQKHHDLSVVLLLIRMYNNTKECAYFHQLPNVVQL